MSRSPILAAVAVALVAGACGVPAGDDTFEAIPDPEVPFDLAAPATTTTTTTTTTVPPTPETTTTVPEEVPDVALEPVALFFVTRDELRPIQRDIETGFAPIELIDLLVVGPDPDISPGLETLVLEDLVASISVQEGTATVDLDDNIYNRIARRDQTLMFAQIVLTLTQSAPRIGLVTFTFDGVAENVPIPNNLFRRIVSFDQYAPLIVNAVVNPAPTTSTTSTTTTTVPPEPDEEDQDETDPGETDPGDADPGDADPDVTTTTTADPGDADPDVTTTTTADV